LKTPENSTKLSCFILKGMKSSKNNVSFSKIQQKSLHLFENTRKSNKNHFISGLPGQISEKVARSFLKGNNKGKM
jgi:hypothetical protein